MRRIRGSSESWITNPDPRLLDPTDHGFWKSEMIQYTDPFKGSKRIQILFLRILFTPDRTRVTPLYLLLTYVIP